MRGNIIEFMTPEQREQRALDAQAAARHPQTDGTSALAGDRDPGGAKFEAKFHRVAGEIRQRTGRAPTLDEIERALQGAAEETSGASGVEIKDAPKRKDRAPKTVTQEMIHALDVAQHMMMSVAPLAKYGEGLQQIRDILNCKGWFVFHESRIDDLTVGDDLSIMIFRGLNGLAIEGMSSGHKPERWTRA